MTVFQTFAILMTFAAAGAYVNLRWMKLPATIGYMGFALGASLVAQGLAAAGLADMEGIRAFVGQIDFSHVLLHGMLSFLLFAGAMHVDFKDLKSVGWSVGVLATAGVAIAMAVTGTLVYYAAAWCGLSLPWIYAFLFGALISPTDPVAVLAMLGKAGLSRTMYAKVAGESLFNDGVGVVAFITILGLALGGDANPAHVAALLAREALGGIVLGSAMGWAACALLRSVDDYKVEVLLTLALAAGGYALAEAVHVSAPIAMVAAGLMVGNTSRRSGMSEKSRKRLDVFWELVDETLNAILFMLVGLHVVLIEISLPRIALGLFAVLAVLAGRFVSVGLPVALMGIWKTFERGTVAVLTWGGLRGGLSMAMALSLPEGREKSIILPVTYIVVLFSILVQGLTFPRVLELATGKATKKGRLQ
jgi:CPA1 family monovalent cation:H+ antiporter